jgi:hypothetical protein
MKLLRRWFGLRCWLGRCPFLLDAPGPGNTGITGRCTDCGQEKTFLEDAGGGP